MNNGITITGRITKIWFGKDPTKPPINLIMVDDDYSAHVNYKVAVWSEREFEIAKTFNEGDEISYSGHIKSATPYANGSNVSVEVVLDKFISIAKVHREVTMIHDEISSDVEPGN